MFPEAAIKHILRAKEWLYGFESVFCQFLTDFLFVLYLLSSCNCVKIEYRQFLIPVCRSIEKFNYMGLFIWFPIVFITLKLIVFLKNWISQLVFNCFNSFCSLLSNCYQTLLLTGPISFTSQFCLVSISSDTILTLILSFVFKTDKFLMWLMFVVVVVVVV